jgi:hypothetical protein
MIEDLNNVPSSNKKATRNQIKSCYQDMQTKTADFGPQKSNPMVDYREID